MVVRLLLLLIYPAIETIVPLVSKVMASEVVVDSDYYYHYPIQLNPRHFSQLR